MPPAPAIPPLHLITATADAQGRLLHAETGLLLHFAPSATVRLLLDPAQVREVAARTLKVLNAGDGLYFDLTLPGGPARATLRMLADAYLTEVPGYSPAFRHYYPCQVETFVRADGSTPPDFVPFRADSVGLAYTQLSRQYQPHRRTHATDNYGTIRTAAGVPLRRLWNAEASDFDAAAW